VLGVVGVVVGMVLAAVWAVRRWVPATREGFDAEVSSQMLGVVASLFGLLLAFVVVIEFQAFSDASDNVQTEADGFAAIVRDSYAFDGRDGASVRSAIGAWRGIDRVFAAMQAVTPVSASQSSFYDDSVRHLNSVLEARSNRLSASDGNDLPALIAMLVIVGAVVILGYAALVGSRSHAFHSIGAGAIAVVVGFSLVVLLCLQFPFSGDLAISSQPFREGALAVFSAKSD
jgi:hypothetical protein